MFYKMLMEDRQANNFIIFAEKQDAFIHYYAVKVCDYHTKFLMDTQKVYVSIDNCINSLVLEKGWPKVAIELGCQRSI